MRYITILFVGNIDGSYDVDKDWIKRAVANSRNGPLADEFELVLEALPRTSNAKKQREELRRQITEAEYGTELIIPELGDAREVWKAIDKYSDARFKLLLDVMSESGINWCSAKRDGHVTNEDVHLVYISGTKQVHRSDCSYDFWTETVKVSELRELCLDHLVSAGSSTLTVKRVRRGKGKAVYAEGRNEGTYRPRYRYVLTPENIPGALARATKLPPELSASYCNGGTGIALTMKYSKTDNPNSAVITLDILEEVIS